MKLESWTIHIIEEIQQADKAKSITTFQVENTQEGKREGILCTLDERPRNLSDIHQCHLNVASPRGFFLLLMNLGPLLLPQDSYIIIGKNNIQSESCRETLNHSQIFSQPWHSYFQMECYITKQARI